VGEMSEFIHVKNDDGQDVHIRISFIFSVEYNSSEYDEEELIVHLKDHNQTEYSFSGRNARETYKLLLPLIQ
jgi:hypothetical protein